MADESVGLKFDADTQEIDRLKAKLNELRATMRDLDAYESQGAYSGAARERAKLNKELGATERALKKLGDAQDVAGKSSRNMGNAVFIASNALQDFQAAGLRGVTNQVGQLSTALGLGAGLAGVMMVGGVLAEQYGGQLMAAVDPLTKLRDRAAEAQGTLGRLGVSAERTFAMMGVEAADRVRGAGGSVLAQAGMGMTADARAAGGAVGRGLAEFDDPALRSKLATMEFSRQQQASPERAEAEAALESLRRQKASPDPVKRLIQGPTIDAHIKHAQETLDTIDAGLVDAATKAVEELAGRAAMGDKAARNELMGKLEPAAREFVQKHLDNTERAMLTAEGEAIEREFLQRKDAADKAKLDIIKRWQDDNTAQMGDAADRQKEQEKHARDFEDRKDRDRKRLEREADQRNLTDMDRAANLTGINEGGLAQAMTWMRASRKAGGRGMDQGAALEAAQEMTRLQLMRPQWAGGAGMGEAEAGTMAARMVAEAAPEADEALRNLASTFAPSADQLAQQIATNNEVHRRLLSEGVRISMGRRRR
jgi:hypothetical protein